MAFRNLVQAGFYCALIVAVAPERSQAALVVGESSLAALDQQDSLLRSLCAELLDSAVASDSMTAPLFPLQPESTPGDREPGDLSELVMPIPMSMGDPSTSAPGGPPGGAALPAPRACIPAAMPQTRLPREAAPHLTTGPLLKLLRPA